MKVITVFVFSRLENPPSTLFSSSIEFSTMELIPLYSASIAMSQLCGAPLLQAALPGQPRTAAAVSTGERFRDADTHKH